MAAIMLKDESKVKNKLKISFNEALILLGASLAGVVEALILLGLSVAGVVVVHAWVTFLWWVFFGGMTS